MPQPPLPHNPLTPYLPWLELKLSMSPYPPLPLSLPLTPSLPWPGPGLPLFPSLLLPSLPTVFAEQPFGPPVKIARGRKQAWMHGCKWQIGWCWDSTAVKAMLRLWVGIHQHCSPTGTVSLQGSGFGRNHAPIHLTRSALFAVSPSLSAVSASLAVPSSAASTSAALHYKEENETILAELQHERTTWLNEMRPLL